MFFPMMAPVPYTYVQRFWVFKKNLLMTLPIPQYGYFDVSETTHLSPLSGNLP
jgi:hypothetical protein